MCKPYRKSATPTQPRAAARCVAKGEIRDETLWEMRYIHSLASANKSSKKNRKMWVFYRFFGPNCGNVCVLGVDMSITRQGWLVLTGRGEKE